MQELIKQYHELVVDDTDGLLREYKKGKNITILDWFEYIDMKDYHWVVNTLLFRNSKEETFLCFVPLSDYLIATLDSVVDKIEIVPDIYMENLKSKLIDSLHWWEIESYLQKIINLLK